MKFIDSEMPWLDATIKVKFCQFIIKQFNLFHLFIPFSLYWLYLFRILIKPILSLYFDPKQSNHILLFVTDYYTI